MTRRIIHRHPQLILRYIRIIIHGQGRDRGRLRRRHHRIPVYEHGHRRRIIQLNHSMRRTMVGGYDVEDVDVAYVVGDLGVELVKMAAIDPGLIHVLEAGLHAGVDDAMNELRLEPAMGCLQPRREVAGDHQLLV